MDTIITTSPTQHERQEERKPHYAVEIIEMGGGRPDKIRVKRLKLTGYTNSDAVGVSYNGSMTWAPPSTSYTARKYNDNTIEIEVGGTLWIFARRALQSQYTATLWERELVDVAALETSVLRPIREVERKLAKHVKAIDAIIRHLPKQARERLKLHLELEEAWHVDNNRA